VALEVWRLETSSGTLQPSELLDWLAVTSWWLGPEGLLKKMVLGDTHRQALWSINAWDPEHLSLRWTHDSISPLRDDPGQRLARRGGLPSMKVGWTHRETLRVSLFRAGE
jgi:hypothetical protein